MRKLRQKRKFRSERGVRGVPLWSRALNVLAEEPGSIPHALMQAHNPRNSGSNGSNVHFRPLPAPHTARL